MQILRFFEGRDSQQEAVLSVANEYSAQGTYDSVRVTLLLRGPRWLLWSQPSRPHSSLGEEENCPFILRTRLKVAHVISASVAGIWTPGHSALQGRLGNVIFILRNPASN